uniref:Uncharacterized protein n=1 Tax=Lepeophtheirus salmonis TaxID=72036 RepID=A0A0K2V2Q1_LEPSM
MGFTKIFRILSKITSFCMYLNTKYTYSKGCIS